MTFYSPTLEVNYVNQKLLALPQIRTIMERYSYTCNIRLSYSHFI